MTGILLLMPKVRSRLIVALALLLLVSNVDAQRSAIDTYAITNARIVTVSGPVIERGTVVIRNGLIAAAGANVNAPPDARLIDGTGLTVYPGLIDSYTDLALAGGDARRFHAFARCLSRFADGRFRDFATDDAGRSTLSRFDADLRAQ